MNPLPRNAYSQPEFLRQAQLTLLTEKRAAFCHLDLVQVAISRRTKRYQAGLDKACALCTVQASLVRQVNRLAGGWCSRREKSLSQALAAFSYITVPSLRSPELRLALYLETAQVTIINHILLHP